MKTTPYEWRKAMVGAFSEQLDALVKQRDALNTQIDDLLSLRTALDSVKLRRFNKKAADQPGPAKKTAGKPKRTPWQHLPKNKAKAAAWRKKMVAANKKRGKKSDGA